MAMFRWSGACDTLHNCTMKTFSVGVFEVLPKSSGNGTKRGKVRVRVSGKVADRVRVHAKADKICAQLEAGTYVGPKTVRLR